MAEREPTEAEKNYNLAKKLAGNDFYSRLVGGIVRKTRPSEFGGFNQDLERKLLELTNSADFGKVRQELHNNQRREAGQDGLEDLVEVSNYQVIKEVFNTLRGALSNVTISEMYEIVRESSGAKIEFEIPKEVAKYKHADIQGKIYLAQMNGKAAEEVLTKDEQVAAGFYNTLFELYKSGVATKQIDLSTIYQGVNAKGKQLADLYKEPERE